jgi:hypothetical protein
VPITKSQDINPSHYPFARVAMTVLDVVSAINLCSHVRLYQVLNLGDATHVAACVGATLFQPQHYLFI